MALILSRKDKRLKLILDNADSTFCQEIMGKTFTVFIENHLLFPSIEHCTLLSSLSLCYCKSNAIQYNKIMEKKNKHSIHLFIKDVNTLQLPCQRDVSFLSPSLMISFYPPPV